MTKNWVEGQSAVTLRWTLCVPSCMNSQTVQQGPENKDGPLHGFTRQGDMHARPHTIDKEGNFPLGFRGGNATVAGGAEEETTERPQGNGF